MSVWTSWLGESTRIADFVTVEAAGALYRVFLLRSSLQVDLSSWPHDRFRAVGGPMRMIFGDATRRDATPAEPTPGPDPRGHVRMGWLYALHARSAVARDRHWQAEMMLADLRHEVIALACLRHGLDPAQGRGAHRLPLDLSGELAAARACDLSPGELRRSLRATLAAYSAEVARHDPELSTSLAPALERLVALAL